MKRWGIIALLALASIGACNDYSEATSDAPPDGGPESGVDASPTDASSEVASDAGDAADASSGKCPAGMLPVDAVTGKTYCIDTTEVTQSAYKKFIVATGGVPTATGQPSECAFNTSFVPPAPGCGQSTFTPESTPDRPVTCIDWCDARAYCAWAGRRLCGRLGGGSVPLDSIFNATVDQWFAACSKHGSQSFPYGNTFDATKCNGAVDGGGAVANVGTFPGCKGGVDDALLDMVGNVSEMQDACDHTDGGSFELDACPTRGGGFMNDSTYLRCDNASGYQFITRNFGSTNVGFRCCADL